MEGLSDELGEDEIANDNSIHFRENPFITSDFKDWAEKKCSPNSRPFS
ncbi:hypothetical protein BSBH6_02724 [Bacillus subtilis]|nr:hypothetical protein BSBH6_02724 [Bacillus subtilis]RPK23690.1 hypothetical protein BH5_02721 [Bacillus subtilis]